MPVPPLPDGVRLVGLEPHRDERGSVTEVHRDSWELGARPVQWNVTRSAPNVVRGMHCHPLHDDYVTVLSGRLGVVLADGRKGSDTFRHVARVELDEDEPTGIVIPVGVAHAFEASGPVTYLYGMDDPWTPSIDFGCSWRDPLVREAFVSSDPLVSDRDRDAGSFDDMVEGFNAFVDAAVLDAPLLNAAVLDARIERHDLAGATSPSLA